MEVRPPIPLTLLCRGANCVVFIDEVLAVFSLYAHPFIVFDTEDDKVQTLLFSNRKANLPI